MNRTELRAEVEQAALAEVERVGPEAWRADTIVRQFADRGVDRATIYRWLKRLKESGRLGAHLAARVHEAAAERLARSPAPDVAAEVGAMLPKPLRPEDVASAGGLLNFSAVLGRSVATAEAILRQATLEDGTIRMPRLALTAAEHLRRCTATAVQIAAAARDISNIEQFHIAIIEAIEAEAPETAARLLARLDQITRDWPTKV